MTRHIMRFSIFLALLFPLSLAAQTPNNNDVIQQSHRVIERFAGKLPIELALSLDKQDGCDRFTSTVQNGKLTIRASSGVALCRGFYDYVKRNDQGLCSWSGNRVALPAVLPDQGTRQVVSPFKYHYNFNVVTYGYTMPYWDWARWESEIDWMALHGVDMPLALVATEAIAARVWHRLGLTDDEISTYFVGPAHFPWMRMGNISQIDGPLPAQWHDGQVELQHKILGRMTSLGMHPICPGFAGFVPKSLARLYPDIKLIETSWGGAFHNWMLSPDQPLFSKIGQMFIEEWEREFGKSEYYIVDSFNEMDIPFPPKDSPDRYSLLAAYGDAVYRSIKAGSPDAVWVMQGWMFGYQRDIWDYKTLQALVSKVPDDKMLLLDLAVDYNMRFWHNGPNWDLYQGFYNKEWVYSVIPNMGGKTGLTGDLEFYANGRLAALGSPNKGRLAGYGMAPEGIENNEVIYELICDGGWTADSIDLDQWLRQYTVCRYGQMPAAMNNYWGALRSSVYGSFTDHPRYNWQFRPGMTQKGTIKATDELYRAIEAMASVANEMCSSPLFVYDLTEMTAHYLGGKMEILVREINKAYTDGRAERALELQQTFIRLALGADRALASHPTLSLERWLDFAKAYATTPELGRYYERNARRIVTIWGPPVDDYSARIWSGLIRDYYVPRWQHYFESKATGRAFDFAAWERDWVEQRQGLSSVEPYADPVAACLELIESAKAISPAAINDRGGEKIGSWTSTDVSCDWTTMEWVVSASQIKKAKGVLLQYVRGANQLMIKDVELVMDGEIVCRDPHQGHSGTTEAKNFYPLTVPSRATGNNSCLLRAKVKSDGAHDSYGNVWLIM
ncbi:MAG: alpha-N-acetylglucosaminidase [Mucinivorans sp.]